MSLDDSLGWRAQLQQVRTVVTTQEKKREDERRLAHERNEEALRKRLVNDTPEALNARFADLHKRLDRAARRFCPLSHIEDVLQEIADFGSTLRFYDDCIKSFPKVFTPAHKPTFATLLGELADLQGGIDRQTSQWAEVKQALEKTTFRPRQPSDDAALVQASKDFSQRAHSIPLSIPADYYSRENENFWVAEREGKVVGFVKYWPGEKVVNFAFLPQGDVNFNKLVRGLLHKFYAAGPLSPAPESVRVHLTFVREVKFFTDLGFVRVETKGPSDWIYQRDLN